MKAEEIKELFVRVETADDTLLTRYACYLIAQNGDSRKLEEVRATPLCW